MHDEYKYGDRCRVKQAITTFQKPQRKTQTNVLVPAGSPVTIVSTSSNMAIVSFDNHNYPCRLDNLESMGPAHKNDPQ